MYGSRENKKVYGKLKMRTRKVREGEVEKMKFKEYQHIERYGTDEVEGIQKGKCHIFYKIDGTNGSVWVENGEIKTGSRKRELTLENDNAGFCQYIMQNERIKRFLETYPNYRLYGEWLVPNAIKTYQKEAWRRFYVFDVAKHKEDETEQYMTYEEYKPMLEEFGIDYIPPLEIIENPTLEQLTECLNKTGEFLIELEKGNGEGIVIKNYKYHNPYGRQTWAKIVASEFREKHKKEAKGVENKESIETKIVMKYCTEAFIEKEYAKIVNEKEGWRSKYIAMLLGRIYSELIKEEAWNIVKEFKNPTIDFKKLNCLVVDKVKETKKELFS